MSFPSRRMVFYVLLAMIAPMAWQATGHAADCQPVTITHAGGSAVALRLETASTPAMRAKGLSNRDTIGTCDGMAFWFPSASNLDKKPTFSPQKFWMKDTRIPLDIIFVDAGGSIVQIVEAQPYSETPVGPETPVSTVIEINGGRAARESIRIGDTGSYEGVASTYHRAR